MKIALIHNLYPPYTKGGAEAVVVKTAQELVSAGHEVVVISSASSGEQVDMVDGVRVYRCSAGNLYSFADGKHHSLAARLIWQCVNMFHIRQVQWVRDLLQKEKPDVVHTHNLMGMSFLIPRVIKKIHTPHVHTVHDVQLIEPSGIVIYNNQSSFRYHNPFSFLYKKIVSFLFGSPDVVISPSQFLLDWYKQRGFFSQTKQLLVIKNIQTQIAHTVPKQPAETLRFLFAGQLEEHKGISVLLEAWMQVSKQYVQAHLSIAGSGSLESVVAQYASTDASVSYLGRLTSEQLSDELTKTDVVVFPSVCIENSPTILFESVLSSTPVIASDMESVREIVREGVEGYLVPVANSEALAGKILWCVKNADEVRAFSARMSETQKQKQASIDELVNVYTNLVVK
jgi:glycosyltransferase involved in cell wall biosynthesis